MVGALPAPRGSGVPGLSTRGRLRPATDSSCASPDKCLYCLDDTSGSVHTLCQLFKRHLLRRRQCLGGLAAMAFAGQLALALPISRKFRGERIHVATSCSVVRFRPYVHRCEANHVPYFM